MGDSGKDCRSWEEEIFWTHFQSIHFFQFLRGDFLNRLEIPKKFTKNMRQKLSENVTLKGPSGLIWDATLKADDDDNLFFDGGWKNFVKDHSFVENDLLIFKYNGVSHFDILIFDGQTMCEKAESYFVRKCVNVENDSGCQAKRKTDEVPVDILDNSHPGAFESSPEKSANNDIKMEPSKQPNASVATNKKKVKKTPNVGSSKKSIPAKRTFEDLADGEVNFESIDGDVYSLPKASGKKPTTQAEKSNAFLMAQEAVTNDGFMVVMKPTMVGRRFYMAVPVAWASIHLPRENSDVILRVEDQTWKIRFNYHKNRDCGGLSGGWRNFVNDNNLEEGDVLVFDPVNLGQKPIVLDVSIFRLLQAPLPLTQVQLDDLSTLDA